MLGKFKHASEEIVYSSQNIAPLEGKRLAPFWRRLVALSLDVFICILLSLLIFVPLVPLMLSLQHPSLYDLFIELNAEGVTEDQKQVIWAEVRKEVFPLVKEHRPDILTPAMHNAIEEAAWDSLSQILAGYQLRVNLGTHFSLNENAGFGAEDSEVDLSTPKITIRHDVVFPYYPFIFDGIMVFFLYFTVMTWSFKGKTLGKWFFRIQILRLDGRKMSLMDSFGRAGGYTASVSTFGLGFIEALWQENRQALHDRIAGTVVVTMEKKSKPKAPGKIKSQPEYEASSRTFAEPIEKQ